MPQQCLELAKEAEDFYVKSALTELAEEFKKQAVKIRDRSVGLAVALVRLTGCCNTNRAG